VKKPAIHCIQRRKLTALLTAGTVAQLVPGPARLQAAPARQSHAAPASPIPPASVPPWETLPPTPALPQQARTGFAAVEGARIFYAEFGEGRPVMFLHGGLANADYWGHQLDDIGKDHRVVAIDLRGHGRSTMSGERLTYGRFAADAIGVMDHLKLPNAAIVGWSDGAIAGLELAMRHRDRIDGLFAFAANFSRDGTIRAGNQSKVFVQYTRRCAAEYAKLSPQPKEYPQFLSAMRAMWDSEPNYPKPELSAIRTRTWVVDGEHDEIISRTHTQELAAAIPESSLVIEPAVSHFALLQNPQRFTQDVRAFLA
jgi:pimeloyl-ACP methyl ester carboxylesterase